jgi:hypothetical protein
MSWEATPAGGIVLLVLLLAGCAVKAAIGWWRRRHQ